MPIVSLIIRHGEADLLQEAVGLVHQELLNESKGKLHEFKEDKILHGEILMIEEEDEYELVKIGVSKPPPLVPTIPCVLIRASA